MAEDNIELIEKIYSGIICKNLDTKEAYKQLKQIISNYKIFQINNNSQDKSLKYFVDSYLEEKLFDGLSNNSINSYKNELDLFCYYINKNIDEINVNDIKDYQDYRKKKFNIKSKVSYDVIRKKLNLFFKWLVNKKIIIYNPLSKMESYKIPRKQLDSLNKQEMNMIRDACRTTRERALIELLYSTGCGLTEICNIELDKFNLEKKEIQIFKNNKLNRIVFFSEDAEKYLRIYLSSRNDNCNSLFVNERKPHGSLHQRAIQRLINLIAKRSKIEKKISANTFRNTFASIMIENGCHIDILRSLLGAKYFYNNSISKFLDEATEMQRNEAYLKFDNTKKHKNKF